MIRVIVVDDKKEHLKKILNALNAYHLDIEVVGAFTNPFEAHPQIIHEQPDALFLDIQMPGKDGFELAADTRHICNRVIFLTCFMEHGPESYKQNAIHFIDKERINDFLPDAISKLKAIMTGAIPEPLLTVNDTQTGEHEIAIKKINITAHRKITLTFAEGKTTWNREIQLGTESYRTLSKFIAYKWLEAKTGDLQFSFISQKKDGNIITNLSQSKRNLLEDMNHLLQGQNLSLRQEHFFISLDKNGYALLAKADQISLSLKENELRVWADNFPQFILNAKNAMYRCGVEKGKLVLAPEQDKK